MRSKDQRLIARDGVEVRGQYLDVAERWGWLRLGGLHLRNQYVLLHRVSSLKLFLATEEPPMNAQAAVRMWTRRDDEVWRGYESGADGRAPIADGEAAVAAWALAAVTGNWYGLLGASQIATLAASGDAELGVATVHGPPVREVYNLATFLHNLSQHEREEALVIRRPEFSEFRARERFDWEVQTAIMKAFPLLEIVALAENAAFRRALLGGGHETLVRSRLGWNPDVLRLREGCLMLAPVRAVRQPGGFGPFAKTVARFCEKYDGDEEPLLQFGRIHLEGDGYVTAGEAAAAQSDERDAYRSWRSDQQQRLADAFPRPSARTLSVEQAIVYYDRFASVYIRHSLTGPHRGSIAYKDLAADVLGHWSTMEAFERDAVRWFSAAQERADLRSQAHAFGRSLQPDGGV